jgi:hypothetical protein
MSLNSDELWEEAREKFVRAEVDIDEDGHAHRTGFNSQEHSEHRLQAGVTLAKLAVDLRAAEMQLEVQERVAMAQITSQMNAMPNAH